MDNRQRQFLITEKLNAVESIVGVFAGTVQWNDEDVHGYILCRDDDSWEIVTDTDDPTQPQPDDRRQTLSYDEVRRLEDILHVNFPGLDAS